jgi:hypothetical protein
MTAGQSFYDDRVTFPGQPEQLVVTASAQVPAICLAGKGLLSAD